MPEWYEFDSENESLEQCRDRRLLRCPTLSPVQLGLRFHKGCIQRHWTQVVEQCDIDGTRVNERLFTQSELEKSVVIRCSDCGGTQMWKKTDEGYEVIHGCISGKQVREMIASAEARGRLDGEEHVFQVTGRMAARHFVDTLKVADELSDEKSRAADGQKRGGGGGEDC